MALEVGDKVQIIIGDDLPFTRMGDIGIVIRNNDLGNICYIDFNGCGNARVFGNGTWWVGTERLAKIED